MRAIAALGLTLLSACGAGSNSYMRVKEMNGEIRVEPVTGKPHDYVVTLRNLLDIGLDPDIKAERDRAALTFLESQCPQGRVVGETEVVTGTAIITGRIQKNYYIQVKCAG